MGSLEERRAQAERLEFIQVNPVARVAMTEQGLRELIQTLEQTLRNFENIPRQT
jgi:hypothetical protein